MNGLFLAPSKRELRLAAAFAFLGFGVMFALTVVVDAPDEPGAIVYMPSVALIALEFGAAGGAVAALLASSLYALSRTIQGANAGVSDIVPRAIPFLVVGILLGWLADRLRRSELGYRRLIETANEGVWIVDSDGVTQFVNDRMAQMLDIPSEELVGRPPPPDAAAIFQRGRKAAAGEYDVELRRRDGTTMWALVSSTPLTGERGGPTGVLGMLMDITERKHAEAMLEEAQGIAHIGSWSWEAGERGVTCSDELYRIAGLSADAFEPTFESFISRVHTEDMDAVRGAVLGAYDTRGGFALMHRLVRPGGEVRVCESAGRVQIDETGKVVRMTGVVHDVTERLRVEDELAAARSARRQATELNDNVVQGLVLAKYALGGGDRTTATRMIDGTLGQARRMIADLIGSERVQAGDLRRDQPVDIDP
ncbi:MAG TPA: PAS domain S-box protein [Gaiellaceae bacterium]|nr:PAS domain S-box protein [Gaiellaceae bacterium]